MKSNPFSDDDVAIPSFNSKKGKVPLNLKRESLPHDEYVIKFALTRINRVMGQYLPDLPSSILHVSKTPDPEAKASRKMGNKWANLMIGINELDDCWLEWKPILNRFFYAPLLPQCVQLNCSEKSAYHMEKKDCLFYVNGVCGAACGEQSELAGDNPIRDRVLARGVSIASAKYRLCGSSPAVWSKNVELVKKQVGDHIRENSVKNQE